MTRFSKLEVGERSNSKIRNDYAEIFTNLQRQILKSIFFDYYRLLLTRSKNGEKLSIHRWVIKG